MASTNGMHETFKEFSFEAVHQMPPHSSLHGHTFKVEIVLRGTPDPVFGWTHNLYEVERVIEHVRLKIDHKYLNEIEGLAVPSLENVAKFIWSHLETQLTGLHRIVIRRGPDGQAEGCIYQRAA